MSDWKTRIEAKLSQGQKPTYDELEVALLGALEERKALVSTADAQASAIDDMAMWLGKIADAFIREDASRMAEIVHEFVKKRVIVKVVPGKQEMH